MTKLWKDFNSGKNKLEEGLKFERCLTAADRLGCFKRESPKFKRAILKNLKKPRHLLTSPISLKLRVSEAFSNSAVSAASPSASTDLTAFVDLSVSSRLSDRACQDSVSQHVYGTPQNPNTLSKQSAYNPTSRIEAIHGNAEPSQGCFCEKASWGLANQPTHEEFFSIDGGASLDRCFYAFDLTSGGRRGGLGRRRRLLFQNKRSGARDAQSPGDFVPEFSRSPSFHIRFAVKTVGRVLHSPPSTGLRSTESMSAVEGG
ncbi:hypothetical protein K438DRAFT_1777154 [Mycena galopus ATCC 62051]|nr:hypothetical protein K438DRAFT_1777154 [Mycena galopus ATCC 62051]